MIHKHGNYKNGYIFAPSSNDKDFQSIIDKDYNGWKNIKCIICNAKTRRNFRTDNNSETYLPITINNNLSDGCFFINGTF